MIRNKQAVFWLIAATVVMLLHALVPHHHLPDQICFVGWESGHCTSGTHQGDDSGGSCSTSDGEDYRCISGQISILPDNNNKLLCLHTISLLPGDHGYANAGLTGDPCEPGLLYEAGVRIKPDRPIYPLKLFPLASLSLRAPPQV